MNPSDPSPGFLRAVSRWEIVALSVNDVIGSGVYLILPVAAAALLGRASVWAILAAGFAVLLLVLCFAEASSLFDTPGGAIVYTRAAFGPRVGTATGWWFLIGVVLGAPAVALIGGFYVAELLGAGREGAVLAAAAMIAWAIPRSRVTSPFERKTATSGACSPLPNACSVRWCAS